MNKYFTLSDWISLLQKLGQANQKIISPQMLTMASGLSPNAALKAIQRLGKKGYLIKLYKRTYANKFAPPRLEEIAMIYGRPCYISFESALENHGLISQMPLVLTCATPRKTKNLKTPFGEIVFHHIALQLFNNYKNERGILWATAEKALLDYLYINAKANRSHSLLDELNIAGLNKMRLKKLSRTYPKSVRTHLKKFTD